MRIRCELSVIEIQMSDIEKKRLSISERAELRTSLLDLLSRHTDHPLLHRWSYPFNRAAFLYLASFALPTTFAVSALMVVAGNTQFTWLEVGKHWVINQMGIIVGAVMAFYAACLWQQWLQKRQVAFQLLDELNGERFEKTRGILVDHINSTSPGSDVVDLEAWLPVSADRADGTPPHRIAMFYAHGDFSHNHAPQRMIYFVYRAYLYDKYDLLDRRLTRDVFHVFFAHWELFLLEFASAFRKAVARTRNSDGSPVYGPQWNRLPDGIETFLRNIGLAGSLPHTHRYIYFPSARDRS